MMVSLIQNKTYNSLKTMPGLKLLINKVMNWLMLQLVKLFMNINKVNNFISHLYKSFIKKVKSLGAFIFKILVVFAAVAIVMAIIIFITDNLLGLCKPSGIWECTFELKLTISNDLIMFFWGLAASIVGVGGIAISRYSQKMEKLKEKTAGREQEIIESMQRAAEYDKLPHPFTFPVLTYYSIADNKNNAANNTIDNSLYCPDIKANLHHLCINVINVIKLRFSREYGNVKLRCVSGYRCSALNDQSNFKEKEEWMNDEHAKGKAIDIDICSDSCNSSKGSDSKKDSDSAKDSDLLNRLFQFIMDRNNCGDLPLGRVVLVSSGKRQWIHISSSRTGPNERKFYRRINGKDKQI